MSPDTTLVIFILGLVLMALGFGMLGLAWRLRGARAARLVFDAEEERDLAWVLILVGYGMGMVGGLLKFGADAPLWAYMVVLVMVPIVAIAAIWLRIRARRATFDEFGELPDESSGEEAPVDEEAPSGDHEDGSPSETPTGDDLSVEPETPADGSMDPTAFFRTWYGDGKKRS